MTAWEFGNNLNWNLVARDTYFATIIPPGTSFIPIPAKQFVVNSRVVLIGCRNTQAKVSWYSAGYASQRLFFSPSSTSAYIAFVQSQKQYRLGLERLNLLIFDDFDLIPYSLEIKISRWHINMELEVWEYVGNINDLGSQLDRIEEKVDVQTGQ